MVNQRAEEAVIDAQFTERIRLSDSAVRFSGHSVNEYL